MRVDTAEPKPTTVYLFRKSYARACLFLLRHHVLLSQALRTMQKTDLRHERNNMSIWSEIWSTYQKYGQHTRYMVKVPELWSTYQKYGQHTRIMVNIPEIWSTYQKYGQHNRNMYLLAMLRSNRGAAMGVRSPCNLHLLEV